SSCPLCRALVWPVILTVLLHAAIMAAYVHFQGGDVASLLCVGEKRIGQPPYEAITKGASGDGYDGQFYYAIARNPWQHQATGIDKPALRHVRILYPALCWLLSWGAPRLLIWAMPTVNLLAVGALAGLGSWLGVQRGQSGWWGFTLPLAVSAGMPALRDLTDPVSTLAVCGLLVAWRLEGRGWVVALWAAAALFSREQNVVIVLGLTCLAFWQGKFWYALE